MKKGNAFILTGNPARTFFLVLAAFAIFLFSLNPELVQRYYASGFYPVLSRGLRFISSLFPFATGDAYYVLLIFFVIRAVFLIFRKRKSGIKINVPVILTKILHTVLILFIVFKLLWGLNYDRPPIHQQLHIPYSKYNEHELVRLTRFFIGRLNALQPHVRFDTTYTLSVLREKAVLAYQQNSSGNALFRYKTPSVKAPLSSWLTSKTGIEGYYNPLSAEANINMLLPAWVLPFVTCHEMAHQQGIAREDEANLLGYLTAVQSDDVNFQYSACYSMLRYLLFEVQLKSPDDYEALYQEISPEILVNFKAERVFWQKYNSQMSSYMNVAFDKFLKLNRQKSGIQSYRNIVVWLWNIHKKELEFTDHQQF